MINIINHVVLQFWPVLIALNRHSIGTCKLNEMLDYLENSVETVKNANRDQLKSIGIGIAYWHLNFESQPELEL